jgi:hypothetical protein
VDPLLSDPLPSPPALEVFKSSVGRGVSGSERIHDLVCVPLHLNYIMNILQARVSIFGLRGDTKRLSCKTGRCSLPNKPLLYAPISRHGLEAAEILTDVHALFRGDYPDR